MAEPIRNKSSIAPTPQNTPASVSTLQSQTPLSRGARPGLASVSERGGGTDASNAAALFDIIQGRLGNLNGLTSGYIESLPKSVKDRVAALKGLRSKQAKIEAEFHRELLALEKKFYTQHVPLYAARKEIVVGAAEPKPEDIEAGEAAFEEEKEMFDGISDDEDDEDDDGAAKAAAAAGERAGSGDNDADEPEDDEPAVTGVPNFWLTAFKNVPHLSDMISDRDNEVLASLVDVRLTYLDKPGFALEFEFADNSFFTNKVLTKKYFYHEEIGLSGEYMYDHAEGTDIKWTSPEVNVTVRIEKRKQRNKHTKATRTIEKTIPEQSFFNFFSPPRVPGAGPDAEDDDEDDVDDEYAANLHSELELDFELGEFFKEKLVPRGVDWFTGRAIDYEGLGPEDEDEEDEGYEGEDDEEEGEEGEALAHDLAARLKLNADSGSVEDMKKEVPENCKQQ